MRLAGDAAARQRAAASEGIQMRRAAMQNKGSAEGYNSPQSQTGGPPGQGRAEVGEQGSPAYQQMMERIRGSNTMKNTGSSF